MRPRRHRAWVPGPSTSPLEAMTRRTSVAVGALLLLSGGLFWILVPPFPAPRSLLDSSLPALTRQFGPPRDVAMAAPMAARGGKALGWEASRGIAFWALDVYFPVNSALRPDMVSRCLHPRWVPDWVGIALFLPCDTVAKSRVMASNNRWRGREKR